MFLNEYKNFLRALLFLVLLVPLFTFAQSRDRKNDPTKTSISDLFVFTNPATNITYTTATLNGVGGDLFANPTLPITAYFRYSIQHIPPIFCNDIYGTKMKSTKDIYLNITNSKSFSTTIQGLIPDTTYYYCAIISNKENIAYGGASIVKTFHTNPITTNVNTNNPTNIKSNSAVLNGYYSSRENITTYFEYKKYSENNTVTEWSKTPTRNYNLTGQPNVFGNTSANITNLSSYTRYQYRIVAETKSGNETKKFYGSIVSFTTNVKDGDNTNNDKPICDAPFVFDYDLRLCIDKSDDGNGGNSCTYPDYYSSTMNRCVTPPYCAPGEVLDKSRNLCVLSSSGRGDGSDSNNADENGRYEGQILTPPVDAVVRFQEGIEHVFVRQIMANAEKYGYKQGDNLREFAWSLADMFARIFGYINDSRKEIRVSAPDVAAYELRLGNGKLTVYEYYLDRIIDIRNITTIFKNASGYEYYFIKRR